MVFRFFNFQIATSVVFFALNGAGVFAWAEKGKICTIGVPVANAYATIPIGSLPKLLPSDHLFADESCCVDTQVLLGDQVRVVQSYKDKQGVFWSGVELLSQPVYRERVWVPKICFIQKEFLSAPINGWLSNARVSNMLVSVYAKPSLKALQLGMFSMGTVVRIVDDGLHGWAKIMLATGVFGYVLATDIISQKYAASWLLPARRAAVVSAVKKFEKTPYRWGGCSGFDERSHGLTGVDCSALVYLSFRASWMNVPRDAHDQFEASFPVKRGKDLANGDLIFLAKPSEDKKAVRVNHVLMVVGPNKLIEATSFGSLSRKDFRDLPEHVRKKFGVRIVSAKHHERIGKSLSDLRYGQIGPKGDFIFLGTFLGDDRTLQKLRKNIFV